MMAQETQKAFGVHSEVGKLHKVMVCAPGRAHQRLTPSNCDQLLFDDVLWVDNAKRDHFDFMQKMRGLGIEVVEMHNLLAETLAIPEARKWVLDNQVIPDQVGLGLVDEIRSYLEGLKPRDLAETMIGGLSTEEFPETHGGEMLKLVKDAAGVTEYLLPPLPNTLYTRDTTCWIYGGVTINSLFWPARHEEPILAAAIYRFHPDFAGKVKVWWGDPTADHGLATLEGGDVMPIGKGNVLIGMSERSSRQGISQVARALFEQGAAERVIVAAMPKLRAAMHLDTVLTFADRLLVPPRQDGERRGAAARREAFCRHGRRCARHQEDAGRRDRRHRLHARAHPVGQRRKPGLCLAGRGLRLRPQHLRQHAAAQGRHRGDHHRRRRARPRSRRRPLHDLPDHPRSGRFLRPWPSRRHVRRCP
jgi:arginine deiminase